MWLAAAIARFYALPPVAIMLVLAMTMYVCYFVLPMSVGAPLVASLVLLPWYEEHLRPRRN